MFRILNNSLTYLRPASFWARKSYTGRKSDINLNSSSGKSRGPYTRPKTKNSLGNLDTIFARNCATTSFTEARQELVDEIQSEQKPEVKKAVSILRRLLDTGITYPTLHDVIKTQGHLFLLQASSVSRDAIWSAALQSFTAPPNDPQRLTFTLVHGGPGIGKTRLMLETLNILKREAENHTDKLSQHICSLAPEETAVLYVTFGSGTTIEPSEIETMKVSPTYSLVLRLLKSTEAVKNNPELFNGLRDMTSIIAQHMTLTRLLEMIYAKGKKYIILCIDEVNQLYDSLHSASNAAVWWYFFQSIGSTASEMPSKLFVVFGGTLSSPVENIIKDSVGKVVSIRPTLLTSGDIVKIMEGLSGLDKRLAAWKTNFQFRHCLSYMSNPPRVLDYFITTTAEHLSRDPNLDLDTINYRSVMEQAMRDAESKFSAQVKLPVDMTAELVNMSLLWEKEYSTTYKVKGRTLENLGHDGYIFLKANPTTTTQVSVTIPFLFLYKWLQGQPSFPMVDNLFLNSWQAEFLTANDWENFVIKYLAFKMAFLTVKSMKLEEFHHGAYFGSECGKFDLQIRPLLPARTIHRFPQSWKTGSSLSLTKFNESQANPVNSKVQDCIVRNAPSATGIDAFFFHSSDATHKVVHILQFKSNEIYVNDPSPLTQTMLDEEYSKTENVFNQSDLAKEGYKFVFGLISNRQFAAHQTPQLQKNMFLVCQSNLEQYFGPTFSTLAQLSCSSYINY